MKMVSIIFCVSPLNMGNALNDPVGDAPGGVKQHDTINMHTFEYWLTCILQQNRILKHFNQFSFYHGPFVKKGRDQGMAIFFSFSFSSSHLMDQSEQSR